MPMLPMCECPDVGSERRVTIQKPKPGATANEAGHVDLSNDDNWTTAGTRWGKFKTRGGTERRVFDQVEASVTRVCDFRWDSMTKTIKPNWRLVIDDQILNLSAVYDIDEQHRTIRCECTEVVE